MAILSCHGPQIGYEAGQVGLWRSLVARPSGGRKVAGSSPASPTNTRTLFRNADAPTAPHFAGLEHFR